MNLLQEVAIHCPYCGEKVTLLADVSGGQQEYVEDCEVCCRPMTITVRVGPGDDCTIEACSESDCS